MNLTEFIAAGIAVLALNVLDSTTTWLCFRQYPDKELRGEANPYMRRLMLKSPQSAQVMKHGILLAVVALLIAYREIEALRLLTILLGLVVLNNVVIWVSRKITGRKLAAPIAVLMRWLHIRERYTYFVAISILLGLAFLLNAVLW